MIKIKLQEKLSKGRLPGEKAHAKMAPVNRPLESALYGEKDSYRKSAVALILIEEEQDCKIVLTQRKIYEGNHSGQVSLPGGKFEDGDENLYETAIRECYEEVGVSLTEEYYIGKLSTVFIPVSKFQVEVHAFYLEETPDFVKDDNEVEAIFTIKVSDLLNDENVKQTDISLQNKLILKNVPYFALENKIIWGATALMLSELKDLLGGIVSK